MTTPSLANTPPSFRFILALYLLLAVAYSVLMPPWEAPDETAHYLVVLHLAQEGRLPTLEETYEAVQTPPYYWLAAQFFRLLDQIDPALTRPYRPPLTVGPDLTRYDWTAENFRFLWGMYFLRWGNILLGGAALAFVYKGVRQLTAESTLLVQQVLPAATIAFMGLLPQFAYNSASLSNDPLANAAGALLFWLLLRLCLVQTTRPIFMLTAALALLAPFVVKLNILPLSLAILLVTLRQVWSRYRWRWPWFVGGSLLLGMVLLLLWLGLSPEFAVILLRSLRFRLFYIRPDAFSGWPFWNLVTFYITSFWGQVGWKDAGLPRMVVVILMALALPGWLVSARLLLSGWTVRHFRQGVLLFFIMVIGGWWLLYRHDAWWEMPASILALLLVVALWTWWRTGRYDPTHGLTLNQIGWQAIWLTAVLTLFAVAKNFLTTPQYQGRFLFPSLGALAFLLTAGWYTLLPARLAAYLPWLIIVFMLVLNAILFTTQVFPVFYQPFWDG
jgi:hypothetical protein